MGGDRVLSLNERIEQEFPMPVVRGFIMDNEGRILLSQRGPKCKFFPGAWVLPGGKHDKGYRIEARVRDEVERETGIEMQNPYLVGFQQNIPTEGEPLNVANFYFACVSYTGVLVVGVEEGDARWVHPFDLDQYKLVFGSREAIETLLGIRYDNSMLRMLPMGESIFKGSHARG
jgi:ADP-ribose pyrophosphatase YjhB (NUDIX family)